ncbi:DUF1799 domain-containing protein [Candidatus Nitrotoga sp. M5]|uniref:DUF1799 domain-containing protein n=1 Tax=Candidatus Nitrotoga sp. M5 TaxID=2890409 RepID=UPI00403D9355
MDRGQGENLAAIASAFYAGGGGGPTDEELKAAGLTRDDIAGEEDEIVWVWPEHEKALDLFNALVTQWRSGFNGATGLDYNVLPFLFELYSVEKAQQLARFDELQIMERAALKAMKK